MLDKTIEITPVDDAALNSTKVSKIVSEIIRNITVFGANKDVTLDKVFMAASGTNFTSGTFPTTGQVTDLEQNLVKANGYYISLLVKDFDGNSRTIFVRIVKQAS